MTIHPASLAIFDLDGTLVDSLEDIADTTNEALAAFGFPPHPAEAYKQFVGEGMLMRIQRAAPPHTDMATLYKIMALSDELYDVHWARKSRPYDGILPMLSTLAKKGVALAVLSNKLHEATQTVIQHFFSDIPFRAVIGSPKKGQAAKPDPTLALDIARQIGVAPEQTIFVGDTRTDMQTATAANMIPLGVLWGVRPADELLAHGAARVLQTPAEIVDVYQEL